MKIRGHRIVLYADDILILCGSESAASNALKQLGYNPPFKIIKMKSWRSACSPLESYALANAWRHEEVGLVDISSADVGITVSMI